MIVICVLLIFVVLPHISVWSREYRSHRQESFSSAFMMMREQKCVFGSDGSWAGETRRRHPPRAPGSKQKNPFAPTTPAKGMKSQMNILKKKQSRHPEMNVGPPKTAFYNPTDGYEPYWPGGNWALGEPKRPKTKPTKSTKSDLWKTTTTTTTKKPEKNCTTDCDAEKKAYGMLCAKDKLGHYKTFNDMCELESSDCTRSAHWLIAYQGPCKKELPREKPTIVYEIVSLAPEFLKEFEKRYKKPAG